MTTPTSGTKINVAQPSDSRVYRSNRPMTIGSTRYISDDEAIAPPSRRPISLTVAASTADDRPTAA